MKGRVCSVWIADTLSTWCVCHFPLQDEVEEDEQEDDISKSKNIKQKEVKSAASSSSSKKGK